MKFLTTGTEPSWSWAVQPIRNRVTGRRSSPPPVTCPPCRPPITTAVTTKWRIRQAWHHRLREVVRRLVSARQFFPSIRIPAITVGRRSNSVRWIAVPDFVSRNLSTVVAQTSPRLWSSTREEPRRDVCPFCHREVRPSLSTWAALQTVHTPYTWVKAKRLWSMFSPAPRRRLDQRLDPSIKLTCPDYDILYKV